MVLHTGLEAFRGVLRRLCAADSGLGLAHWVHGSLRSVVRGWEDHQQRNIQRLCGRVLDLQHTGGNVSFAAICKIGANVIGGAGTIVQSQHEVHSVHRPNTHKLDVVFPQQQIDPIVLEAKWLVCDCCRRGQTLPPSIRALMIKLERDRAQ